MTTFVRAVGAEFRKVFSTRLWWVLALILFGYVGLSAAGIAFLPSIASAEGGGGMPDASIAPIVYSMTTATGFVFPVIFGAMSITGEIRHRTLGTAFLATPQRAVVLSAKALAAAVLGALFGLLGLAASVGLGALTLLATGQETLLGESETWLMFARIVLAMGVWGLVGVGVGVMIPSQIGSIVAILAFTQFVEPLLRAAAAFASGFAEVGRFLPGAAGDALVGQSIFSSFAGLGLGPAPLEWWQGGLVLAAYAVVFGIIGSLTTWRRDLT
jgi:ABC-2 type transport system permease protein